MPQFGYRAAALITIASEIVLLMPFGWLVQGALGRIDWLDFVWRPVVATGAMLAVALLGWGLQPLVALAASVIVYGVVLLALRPLNAAELATVRPLLPGRVRESRLLGPVLRG